MVTHDQGHWTWYKLWFYASSHALAINKISFLAVKLEGDILVNTLLHEVTHIFINEVSSLLLMHNIKHLQANLK